MKYLQKFNESENRTLKQVLDEAMFEIKDNFDVTIFDEGRSVRDFEHGVVVLSIIFEYMNSRGEFSFKDDNSFMGENYPGIDTGIEYADTYAAFLKAIKKVMAKLESEGFSTKLRTDSLKSFKFTIHKPRKPDWVD